MAQHAEEQDKVERLQWLKIWSKFERGEIHCVTQEDVDEVFAVMDADGSGTLSVPELMSLQFVESLKLTDNDLKDLVADADKDGTGDITPIELYKAITAGTLAFNQVKESLGKREQEIDHTQCERPQLIEWMKYEHETNTALWSLPVTIATFAFFVLVAVTHVDMFHSFWVHTALMAEFPTLLDATKYKTVDVQTLNYWTTAHWIPIYYRQDPVHDPVPGRLAHLNQMIAGARIMKTTHPSGDCPAGSQYNSLYESVSSQCRGHADLEVESVVLPYHLRQSVILEIFENMTRSTWIDEHASRIEYQSVFFNPNVNLMTVEIYQWNLQEDGLLKPRTYHESWLAVPYLSFVQVLPDICFLILLFRLLYTQLKELMPAVSAGIDGVIDYLGFWQMVDWVTIMACLAGFATWMYVYIRISVQFPKVIEQVPKKLLDDAIADRGGQYLTVAELNDLIPIPDMDARFNALMDESLSLFYLHGTLRMVFIIDLFVLMFKFFKSFRANPRLDIVIQSLIHCASNVAHFFIVFGAIFCCYAFAGHFLVGHKIKGFSTELGALFTCWRSLVGIETINDFDYGVQVVGYLWSFSYEWLVLYITLNMLLGIVFDAYYSVKSRVEQPLTIWAQLRNAIATAAETRSHISLLQLIVLMEDDDYPAHPGNQVSAISLKKAFEKEKMTRQNSHYLLKKTIAYIQEQAEDTTLNMNDAIKIVGQSNNTSLKILDTTEEALKSVQQYQAASASSYGEVSIANSSTAVALSSSQPQEMSAQDVDAHQPPNPSSNYLLSAFEDVLLVSDTARQEQMKSYEMLRERVRKECAASDQRSKLLDEQLDEFKSRLLRAERCIKRLTAYVGDADFCQLAGLPERMEQDIMLCFGSKLMMAQEGVQAGEILALEQKTCKISDHARQLVTNADNRSEAQQLLWKIRADVLKLQRRRSNSN